jgi:hypothetical protein
VANGCGGGRVCCFNGSVTMGGVCPKQMSDFDTACIDIDLAAPHPCYDPVSTLVKVLMCANDGDCQQFDAGTCTSALMPGINRVMGICTP